MIDPALEFPNDRDYNLGVPWVKSGYWNKNMQGRERVRAPESLRGLDAEIAGLLLAASADITLVIDAEGFIRDIATGDQFSDKNWKHWIGRRWIETVTRESRTTIEELSWDANACSSLRWLQVTH